MNSTDRKWLLQAIELAKAGQGLVEPNPMVGCVIVNNGTLIGQGFHRKFGSPHAEIEALNGCHELPAGATAYVSLEPCCHHGKTPPCTQALIDAGIGRVVVGVLDPSAKVNGQGVERLRQAGIKVDTAAEHDDVAVAAAQLIAPFAKLATKRRPWVIAKWAMTLDGKLATRMGDSQWISNELSRARVHEIRGQVDAVLVGGNTARVDDPLLTSRPPGPRTPLRVVLTANPDFALVGQLVATCREFPTMFTAASKADPATIDRLRTAGCEVFQLHGNQPGRWIDQLLDELGKRNVTNLLVEGGARLLGSLFDASAVDAVHVFIAPKIMGGKESVSPVLGQGVALMDQALQLDQPSVQELGSDVHVSGRIQRP